MQDPARGRPISKTFFGGADDASEPPDENQEGSDTGYLDLERKMIDTEDRDSQPSGSELEVNAKMSKSQRDQMNGRVVDIVLSDMSEPWEQTTGFGKKSISDPYFRLMNTSGMPFRDHAGSMVCYSPIAVESNVDIDECIRTYVPPR